MIPRLKLAAVLAAFLVASELAAPSERATARVRAWAFRQGIDWWMVGLSHA